jgi:hypothetical protein
MQRRECEAGDGQIIELYEPEDLGGELYPGGIFAFIADAGSMARNRGVRILSMTSMALRETNAFMGKGSYQTKAAVAVVYEPIFGLTRAGDAG